MSLKNASCASGGKLTYATSDPKVAEVSEDGTVSAVGLGTCEITVSAPGTSKYEAAVKKVAVQVVKKTQSLSGSSSYSVTVGDSPFPLNVTALGGASLSYVSSDTSVCTVSDGGVVTILGAGSCTITVTAAETAEYQRGTLTITVTVLPAPTEAPEPPEP